MDPYENHEAEWREEELQLRADRRREQAMARNIAGDPYYPPNWAAEEFERVYDAEA